MQYPEITSVAVEQAWLAPGSLKPRGGHHLEPQGFKGLFVSGTAGHFFSAHFFFAEHSGPMPPIERVLARTSL